MLVGFGLIVQIVLVNVPATLKPMGVIDRPDLWRKDTRDDALGEPTFRPRVEGEPMFPDYIQTDLGMGFHRIPTGRHTNQNDGLRVELPEFYLQVVPMDRLQMHAVFRRAFGTAVSAATTDEQFVEIYHQVITKRLYENAKRHPYFKTHEKTKDREHFDSWFKPITTIFLRFAQKWLAHEKRLLLDGSSEEAPFIVEPFAFLPTDRIYDVDGFQTPHMWTTFLSLLDTRFDYRLPNSDEWKYAIGEGRDIVYPQGFEENWTYTSSHHRFVDTGWSYGYSNWGLFDQYYRSHTAVLEHCSDGVAMKFYRQEGWAQATEYDIYSSWKIQLRLVLIPQDEVAGSKLYSHPTQPGHDMKGKAWLDKTGIHYRVNDKDEVIIVDLSTAPPLSDHDFDRLCELPHLKQLIIHRQPRISLWSIQKTANQMNLEALTIGRTQIGHFALERLRKCKNLKHLGIRYGHLYEDDFDAIGRIDSLETLDLKGAIYSDSWLSKLSALPNLKYFRNKSGSVCISSSSGTSVFKPKG